ncbi:MAG: hypothetical protein IJE50_06300 [Clostridia bacterium]|nr:hypothetical protein [Clostridia bacterium]
MVFSFFPSVLKALSQFLVAFGGKTLRNHLCFVQSQTTEGMLLHKNTSPACVLSANRQMANQPFIATAPFQEQMSPFVKFADDYQMPIALDFRRGGVAPPAI